MWSRFFCRSFTTKAAEQLTQKLHLPDGYTHISRSIFKTKQSLDTTFKRTTAKYNEVQERDFVNKAISMRARHG